MTYEGCVKEILDIPKFTTKHELAYTKQFLRWLGSPEEGLSVIHVAGTNGKGSVCAYCNAMLRAQGKRVGLFTSPHLVEMTERIRINGEEITKEQFTQLYLQVKKKVNEMLDGGLPHPTFFEYLFGMAMLHFAQQKVEYVILETGLGGRLDATNAVESPIVSVITSIGLDHTQILGETLSQIAYEKAGIIKRGIPVFYAQGEEETNEIIEQVARDCQSRCKKIGKDAYEILGIQEKDIAFLPSNAYYGDTTWSLHNIGIYQPLNAMLAMEVMREILGQEAKPMLWRQVLREVVWEGRMEEIFPDFYVDGAHNPSAMRGFVESVARCNRPHCILFSAVEDKDYAQMIEILCKGLSSDFYLVVPMREKRAASGALLQATFQSYTDKPVYLAVSLEDAFALLCKIRGERVVYAVGSLYFTGMIKQYRNEKEARDAEL